MKDDCMARKTKIGADGKIEKIKDEKIKVKPTFTVKKEEPTTDGKPTTPAKEKRVALKKQGEACVTSNDCQGKFSCLPVEDRRGDQSLKCVIRGKFGCDVGP
jgi:hypothetical protein